MEKQIAVWELNGVMNAGGTESLIMELLRNKPENVDVKMIIHRSASDPSVGMFDSEIRDLGVEMYYLPSVGSVGLKKYRHAFLQLVEKIGKPDIIHCHMNAVGGMICRVAKEAGIKSRIVHCHADIKYRGGRLSVLKNEIKLMLMKRYVKKYANEYRACSVAAAHRLFGKIKEFTVIPNVINVEKYLSDDAKKARERAALGVLDGAIAIGAVGRIARIKNYEIIIDAVKILKDKGQSLHFYCYGRADDKSYMDELAARIEKNGVGENVHFLGNSDRIYDAIAAFDIFVMPSVTEGLGIAALEAQAAGVPTLISVGVPNEADMELSLVTRVKTWDAMDWADAIENASPTEITHKDICDAFAKKGYNSKTKCADIYSQYFDMVKKNEACK